MVVKITKQQARQFLLQYHHLTDETALKNDEELLTFIKKIGCLQFDPLNIAGKNADVAIASRYPGYTEDAIYKLLYEDVQLMDAWDKNMSIIHVEDWPFFLKNREKSIKTMRTHQKLGEEVLSFMKEEPIIQPAQLPYDTKVSWGYGTGREATAAVDTLFYQGKLIVHHKQGTRKFYCVPEERLPDKIFQGKPSYRTDDEYFSQLILRRINSVGMMWNKTSDAFLNWIKITSKQRVDSFTQLIDENRIIEIMIEDVSTPFYVAKENIASLLHIKDTNEKLPLQKSARIIAPLDNLMWDRNIIKELFDFSYKWEVYTPREKRVYGHYVFPVLFSEKMIGRIELKSNRQEKTLSVLNFWWEEDISKNERIKLEKKVRKGIENHAKFCQCGRILYEEQVFLYEKTIV